MGRRSSRNQKQGLGVIVGAGALIAWIASGPNSKPNAESASHAPSSSLTSKNDPSVRAEKEDKPPSVLKPREMKFYDGKGKEIKFPNLWQPDNVVLKKALEISFKGSKGAPVHRVLPIGHVAALWSIDKASVYIEVEGNYFKISASDTDLFEQMAAVSARN